MSVVFSRPSRAGDQGGLLGSEPARGISRRQCYSRAMHWRDDGIIIGGRRHGETSLILEVLTRRHGRHAGLVKGGRGKRMLPMLQAGNGVEVTWRARLEDHLGLYAVEATRLRAAELMGCPASLHGLNLVVGLLRLLAEREPHEALYEAVVHVVDRLDEGQAAPALLVRLEAAFLSELGFGIDLTACAATGSREELVYVSPRSARAVSRVAGDPYRERLLALPRFLRGEEADAVPLDDVFAGFALTGFFLARNVFTPRGLSLPEGREAYLTLLKRSGRGKDR